MLEREHSLPSPLLSHSIFPLVILGFLLKVYARYIGSDMAQKALEMTLSTLRAMANGGIHDHVAQVS